MRLCSISNISKSFQLTYYIFSSKVAQDAHQGSKVLCEKNNIEIPGGFAAYLSHTYTHTHIHTPYSNIWSFGTYTLYIHSHPYIHIHPYIHTYTHTYTRTPTYTYTHSYTHTPIHTHTHTYTHLRAASGTSFHHRPATARPWCLCIQVELNK